MRRPQRWSLVLLLGLALVAAYVPVSGTSIAFELQSAIYLIVALGGAAVTVATARVRTRRRRSWWLIAGGVTASALGDVLWTGHEVIEGRDPPFPWIADGLYVAGWLAIIVGVAALVRDPDRTRRVPAWLDAGVLTLAGAVGLWLVVVSELLDDAELSGLALAVSLAYPLLDLALLGLLAGLLLDRKRTTPALRLIGLAAAVQLVADVIYAVGVPFGGYESGGPADLGWLLAYVLIAAAALHPSSELAGTVGAAASDLSHRRVLLLWFAVLSTTVVAVAAGYPSGDDTLADTYAHVTVGAIAVILMATLVLWRLALVAGSLTETLRDRERLQQRLEHEASHDPLTGLANRRRFTEVSRRQAERGEVAILFVDLDRFKEVNDRLGHAAGDEVLQVVAARLVGALRPHDLAARFGGDEFAALLTDLDPVAVDDVATRILHLIRAPIVLANGTEVRIDASVGTARTDVERERSQDLLHDADVAMYEAKRAGRSRVTAYSADVHAQVTDRLILRDDLRGALSRRELSVVYQPIVTVEGRRPVAVEALLRWHHPIRGAVPPDEFIPLAETSGDILTIGRFVLAEACRTVVGLTAAVGPLNLNVNVSAVQLHHGSFVGIVEEVLAETGFDPRRLALEITESVLLEDAPIVRTTVEHLRGRGVRFAVDDFGTGFSALRYLRDVPLDELKIDRTFVRGVDEGPEEAALAFAILHLADSFGLATVGEGVETEDQLAALAGRGCDLAQGYLISRPLPTDELRAWLAAQPGSGAADGRTDAATRSGTG